MAQWRNIIPKAIAAPLIIKLSQIRLVFNALIELQNRAVVDVQVEATANLTVRNSEGIVTIGGGGSDVDPAGALLYQVYQITAVSGDTSIRTVGFDWVRFHATEE